ncbi:MAG: tyrosine-type recombinase/integrase [Bacteroidales bacterium]|nr:tyrosine-type recombinase/integrase [Bacteroidales bacterium]
MENLIAKQFQVKILHEGNYYRLYVTHPSFKGRVKKRIGNDSQGNVENIGFHLRHELENHFTENDITFEAITSFVENYISLRVKFNASIFTYFDDFIGHKMKVVNKWTKNRLVKPTLTSYATAKRLFEEYLTKKRINPYPALINREVLDNFYYYIDGKHNYKVKMHRRLKAFITYLDREKGFHFNPSYKSSTFVEEYDNQEPEHDDIALTIEEVQRLIELRSKIYNNEIDLPMYRKNDKIPESVQRIQFNMKRENLKHCLDCFLFMISTGQYHSDIIKSRITITDNNGVINIKYRRAKNGSLCKAIPINNDTVFIGKEIIDTYKIRSGSNFPLNLSNTHFNKHLERISELAGLGFKLNNKMARKTFASILYYNRKMPIHLLQSLLGHKNVNNTMHYLRISDESLVNEVDKIMFGNS